MMFKSIIKPIHNAAQSNVTNSLACVQYHRKPRWLPQAKSKIFRVPERRRQNEDEKAELMRLHNHYKTQVRAVRTYLFEEVRLDKATSTADHVIVKPEEEAAEMQQCIELNNAWNASIAEIRNNRLEKKMNIRKEFVLAELEHKRKRDQKNMHAARGAVLKEKKLSKTFILEENVDQAIEYALALPVDHYNFAIDLEHEIQKGRISTDDNNENKSATATN